MDADGDLDLIAGELNSGAVFYFRQDDPATFVTRDYYSTGDDGISDDSSSVAVGDFNGDGKQDLAVAHMFSGNVGVLLGDGQGAFQSAATYAVGSFPGCVAVGDFNGDDKQDLVTANRSSNNVSVLLGDGHGAFQSAVTSAAEPLPSFLAVGDFNGDGKRDLVVTSDSLGYVTLMLGRGDGTFQRGNASGPDIRSVALGDFNGDGKQDLATASDAGLVTVQLGNGNGSFQMPSFYPVAGHAVSVAVGDFNGDGKQDLATANYDIDGVVFSNDVNVLLGNGNGAFQTAVNYSLLGGTGPAFSMAVGDFFNSDGSQDLAMLDRNGEVVVLRGDGHGAFAEVGEFFVGGGGIVGGPLAVGDFNGDGKQDLAVVSGAVASPWCCPATTPPDASP